MSAFSTLSLKPKPSMTSVSQNLSSSATYFLQWHPNKHPYQSFVRTAACRHLQNFDSGYYLVDTDLGIDDFVAILLALASPEFGDSRFEYTSYGCTDVDASYLNIFKLYRSVEQHLTKHPEEKEYTALNTFMEGYSCTLRTKDVHSINIRNGLGDITNRHREISVPSPSDFHPYLKLSNKSGTEVCLDILRSRPARSVTYIIIGPLTNLAQLMRADSQLIADRIGRIVCICGAIDIPGNTSAVAEFNFFLDP
ncbi:inosine-uridine preferring nucleoside hydrolase-domain-containing protein [Pholiota molesta]|nr:inosine-uridine preferring nucleoside hydrolase-domain-containing protein [Pholiota molesta]